MGVIGGFTTFSAFGLQTFHLSQDGLLGFAVLNVAASVLLGIAAVWIGYRAAEAWLGA